MVTAAVESSGKRVGNLLEDMDIVGALSVGVVGVGGFLLAEEVAMRVFDRLDQINSDPSEMMDYGAHVLVKLLSAVLLVKLASGQSSYVFGTAGALALGMLFSVGLDLVEFGEEQIMPMLEGNGGSGSSALTRSTPSPSPSPKIPSGGSPSAQRRRAANSPTSIDNGHFRGT